MGDLFLEDWEETFVIPGVVLVFKSHPTAESIARLRRLVDDVEEANKLRPLVKLHKD